MPLHTPKIPNIIGKNTALQHLPARNHVSSICWPAHQQMYILSVQAYKLSAWWPQIIETDEEICQGQNILSTHSDRYQDRHFLLAVYTDNLFLLFFN